VLRIEQLIFAEISFEHHGQTHRRWCVAKDNMYVPRTKDEWNYSGSDYVISTPPLIRTLPYGEIKEEFNLAYLEEGINEVSCGKSNCCIVYY